MQTTKAKILSLLKRRGRLAVDALSDELGLAPMTVRQHLTSLERDRLIEGEPERQAKGRPHFVYSLTRQGEDSFPKRYDWLVAEVLSELGQADPFELSGLTSSQRTEYILGRIADRVASPHLAGLRRLGIEDRVREVASILHRESGFVEWSKTPGGYAIDDYNCMYRALTGESSVVCTWHRRIIGDLVGIPAIDAASEGNGTHCRYVLELTALQPTTDGDVSESESSWPRTSVAQLISQEVHT